MSHLYDVFPAGSRRPYLILRLNAVAGTVRAALANAGLRLVAVEASEGAATSPTAATKLMSFMAFALPAK